MFHSRRLNNNRNLIHERALKITFNDILPSFSELLNKDISEPIHHRGIRELTI